MSGHKDYSTLQWNTNLSEGTALLLLFYIYLCNIKGNSFVAFRTISVFNMTSTH